MNYILLLFSPQYGCARSLERALQLAREQKAGVAVVAVISDAGLAELATTLSNVAFVAEKLSADVAEHLRSELEGLAKEQLAAAERQAKATGIPVTTHVIHAQPLEAAEQMMKQYPISQMIVAIPQRPWFEKLWGRDRALEWIDEVWCPVEAIEEERS
ncbi:MAG: hypothetical protein N3C12_08790 [Candidatus Binatia bacterium]|nr:hypothetical protein [Candidatus Binatia bacterium]